MKTRCKMDVSIPITQFYFSLLWLLFHFTVQFLCLFSLILRGLHEEGEYRQLEFWPESGAKLRYLLCATPNAVKINGFFPNLSKILGRRSARGAPGGAHKPAWRGNPPRPCHEGLWEAHWPTCSPLLLYGGFLRGKKIKEELFHGFAAATRRNLSRTNLELEQDDPAGETSHPEGEIVAIVITNTPLIRGDSSPSTSSLAPSHLQTLVHLL